jgi:hypothetical protein
MPATLYITAAQLKTLAEYDSDVVFNELPPTLDRMVEVWLMKDSTASEHRSLMLDSEGEVVSDMVEKD